jgi:hypothetical protein
MQLFSRRVLLFAFCWIVAAASFSGIVGKWGLRDAADLPAPKKFPIEGVLDGTAYRPFVYRQMIPTAANYIDSAVTPEMRDHLRHTAMSISSTIMPMFAPEQTFSRIRADQDPRFRFRYLVVFYLTFFGLFLSLFVLRRACILFGIGGLQATLAAAAFVLALPYLETVGGYYYDVWELLFSALVFVLAARGKAVWLVVVAALATFNKETFFFLLPALYPLLRVRLARLPAWITTASAIVASTAVNLAVKAHFAANPGDLAENHLLGNLAAYARLRTYGRVEATYGIAGPGGLSLLTVLLVTMLVMLAWPRCSGPLRQHLMIAAALNLPLFVAFCEVGELRNFSMLYVGFVVLLGYVIEGMSWGLEQRSVGIAF